MFTTSQAYEAIESTYDFSIHPQIGKGLDHLRRVQKIIMYVQAELQSNLENINVRYSFDSETIVINNVTKYKAIDISKKIERQINSSKNSIGGIKINPIYESVILDTTGTLRSIEIITTYPNGNTDNELDILLQISEEARAKEVRTTVIAADDFDNSKYIEGVGNLLTVPSHRGYLSDVRSNGKTIININNSIIKTE